MPLAAQFSLLYQHAPGGTISPINTLAQCTAHQKEAIFLDSLGNLLNKGAIIAELVGVI